MDSTPPTRTECLAALALELASRAAATPHGLVFIDATGDRLDDLATAAAFTHPALPVLTFPAWDSLPYDRSPPSAAIVGRRVAAMAHLAANPAAPCLLLTSARAILGRVPPPTQWNDAALTLTAGDCVDLGTLADRLHGFGYVDDEHVDEPGQAALRAHIIDIFPGDSTAPHRLPLVDGRIETIHRIDAATQRSHGDEETKLVIRPVTDVIADEEHAARLVCLLTYMPQPAILLHEDAQARFDDLREQVADAYAATARARRTGADGPAYLAPPSQLFTEPAELTALLADAATDPSLGQATAMPPIYRPASIPAAITQALAFGRVVIAAGAGAARLHTALTRRNAAPVRLAPDWQDAMTGPLEIAAIVPLALPSGFARNGLTVIAAPTAQRRSHAANRLTIEEPPRFGDIVVHRGHGVCRLRGLATVGEEERVALEFAGDTELLVPTDELEQIWRYGSEADAIALDKVDGAAWRHREAEIGAEIAATAKALAAEAATRAKLQAPAIEPPSAPYARFTRRFPFRSPPTRPTPSMQPWPTWRPAARWTAWSAVTSVSARPRWPSAPPPQQPLPATRSPSSPPPPFSPGNTWTPSPAASPASTSLSAACSVASPLPRAAPSSLALQTAASPSSSAPKPSPPTRCASRTWP